MRRRVCSGQLIAVSRIALVGAIGSLAAACSGDTMRFAENPFSNPFAASERYDTNATPAAQPGSYQTAAAPMPNPAVQAQALPPIQAQPLPQPAQVAAAPAVSGGAAGWSAAGGTQITVGPGDNLNTISQRYGVPANAILAASGLSNASQVRPGQRVVIPIYNAGGATRVASAVAPTPAPSAAPAQPKFRLVENSKAAAKPVEPVVASRPSRPGTTAAAKAGPAPAKPAPVRVAAASQEPPVTQARPAEVPQRVSAYAEPQTAPKPTGSSVAPAPAPAPVQQPETVKVPTEEPEQTASVSPAGSFRWPARGRVIAGFGANGGNEGINIALPEGTPVKAAEDGVVTYAGSEVKGYGNLILIRHDNGYVSAYAHNSAINVKRGERVKRGQVIATSGQTGNVTSPQLHFEIRKGATPVDPLKHLSG